MSINSALLAGVSGLIANSSALATISDNIANSNTVGYKTVDTSFADIVTNSSVQGDYDAGGVLASAQQLVTQQGNATQTSSNTDLSISGQGMFVVTANATPSVTDTRSFTRAGSFTLDANGDLQNAAGLYLQGWPVNADGTVAVDPSSVASLETINVGQVGGIATPTTQVSLNANLNADQTLSASATNVATATASGANWSYSLPANAANVTYTVTDSTGATVYSSTQAGVASGSNAFAWNGATTAGGQATVGGAYTLTVSATDSSGNAISPIPAEVAGGYDPTTNSMAAYNATTGTGTQPDFTMSIPISDSEGGQRTLQLDVLKSSAPNTWYAELVASPASDVTDGAGLSNGQIATGTLVFNSDGTINMGQSSVFGGTSTPSVDIGASGTTPAAGQVAWSSGLGIGASNINLSVSTAPGGITQLAATSAVQSVDTNGTQFGNLTSVDIDDQGFVTAVYDNGVSRKIAQVAIATFQNPDGLKSVSGDAYQVSSTSGAYNLKTPGTAGAGTISPSTLEASTVDLSQQFAGLITTQQAYAASAKILTTADQMLQSLVSIIQ
jgi:flagellar hook protein FlgE